MKKTIKAILSVIIVLSLVFCAVSCSGGGINDGFDNGSSGSNKGDGYTGGSSGSSEIGSSIGVIENRKIIKTVNESVQTDSYDDFMAALETAISEAGGYVSSREEHGENYYNKTNVRYVYMTIRIPADKLEGFTKAVDDVSVVTSYRESINDVTTAYIDVESRITVLKAEETALLSMLEQSNNVDTALKIRSRLLEVQSDLASLESQKESYDDRIAFSTVNLSVSEVRRVTTENPTFFEEVGDKFSESIYEIGEGFRSIGVWLLGDSVYIIIWAGVLVGAFFLLKYIMKARARKKEERKATEKNEITTEKTDKSDDKNAE